MYPESVQVKFFLILMRGGQVSVKLMGRTTAGGLLGAMLMSTYFILLACTATTSESKCVVLVLTAFWSITITVTDTLPLPALAAGSMLTVGTTSLPAACNAFSASVRGRNWNDNWSVVG